MESRYINLPNYPFSLTSSAPPRLAIDRFLGFGGGNKIRVSSSCYFPCLQDYVEALNLDANNGNGIYETNLGQMKNETSHVSASLVKRKWVQEEDRMLEKLVKQYGVKKWALIAQKMDGRTPKQCRERWQNHLRPDIKKDLWSEEEEKIFIEAHKKLGNRWSEIARRMPGRTENAVKNHWNAAKRRKEDHKKHLKKKESSFAKSSSLLQDYIKSSNLRNNCETETCHQESRISPTRSLSANEPPPQPEYFDDELNLLTHHLQPPPLQTLGFMDELPNESAMEMEIMGMEIGDQAQVIKKEMNLIDDLFFNSLGWLHW